MTPRSDLPAFMGVIFGILCFMLAMIDGEAIAAAVTLSFLAGRTVFLAASRADLDASLRAMAPGIWRGPRAFAVAFWLMIAFLGAAMAFAVGFAP